MSKMHRPVLAFFLWCLSLSAFAELGNTPGWKSSEEPIPDYLFEKYHDSDNPKFRIDFAPICVAVLEPRIIPPVTKKLNKDRDPSAAAKPPVIVIPPAPIVVFGSVEKSGSEVRCQGAGYNGREFLWLWVPVATRRESLLKVESFPVDGAFTLRGFMERVANIETEKQKDNLSTLLKNTYIKQPVGKVGGVIKGSSVQEEHDTARMASEAVLNEPFQQARVEQSLGEVEHTINNSTTQVKYNIKRMASGASILHIYTEDVDANKTNVGNVPVFGPDDSFTITPWNILDDPAILWGDGRTLDFKDESTIFQALIASTGTAIITYDSKGYRAFFPREPVDYDSDFEKQTPMKNMDKGVGYKMIFYGGSNVSGACKIGSVREGSNIKVKRNQRPCLKNCPVM